jgi:hypothetical protein
VSRVYPPSGPEASHPRLVYRGLGGCALRKSYVWVAFIDVVPYAEWWTRPDYGTWTGGRVVATFVAGLMAVTALPMLINVVARPAAHSSM